MSDRSRSLEDILFLYELALSIGHSMDPRENCEAFLSILLTRRNFSYAAVWLFEEVFRESGSPHRAHLYFAIPRIRAGEERLPRDHSIFSVLSGRTTMIAISSDERGYADLITESGFATGSLLLLRLHDIGCVKLLRKDMQRPQRSEMAQLNAVTEKLATVLKGAFDHQRLRNEISERERAEEAIHELNASLEKRVTERTAQLRAANKELESFSYSVSHDLRAPLRAIDGFSEAVIEDYVGQLDEQGIHYLHRVRAASQRMGILIDSLLQLSRISRHEIKRETVDLSAMATEIAVALRESAPERAARFHIGAGLYAKGDAVLLRTALENLLGNAWKYSAGRALAQITFDVKEIGGEQVFFVQDNGVGFGMQFAGKLFGAFQRLHLASEFEGNGIGLATVQRIIHHHGGRIWARAEIDSGAEFCFTI